MSEGANRLEVAGRRASPGSVRRDFQPWNDPAARPLVEFRNVTKRFGATVAVDQLSLSIHQREFFALLGPSGCGKTTLMRMLAGFEQPDEGEILLDGADITAVPPHRRPVNMMFQSYALFPHMSVAANIAFGLKQAGMGKAEIATRVADLLKLVQLEKLGARKPDQLSGGQRQRVALARAIARRPKLLLLDEPLAALDRKLREETQFELMQLQRDLKMAFMVVTHDQDEAMAMAQRIAVMRAGRIEQLGDARDIYEMPATTFVAQFIGEINLFAAQVERGQVVRCQAPQFTCRLSEPVAEGAAVSLAVRPERIKLTRAATTGAVTLAGEVLDSVYLGDVKVWRVKTSDGTLVRVSAVNAGNGAEDVQRGERVHLSFSENDIRVLPR